MGARKKGESEELENSEEQTTTGVNALPIRTDPFARSLNKSKAGKNATAHFKTDRRTEERPETSGRRHFLRPSAGLKRRGYIIAAVLLVAIIAICTWLLK